MVATDSAILPWHRQTLGGAPAPTPPPKEQALTATDADETSAGFQPFGGDGFSFFDLIDVVNPLQHIPVIGTLYRELTGDTLDPLPRIAGSTLFFGPVGAAFSTADVVLEEASGQDVGEHVMAMLRSDEPLTRATADAATPPTDVSQGIAVVASKPVAAGTDGELASLPPALGAEDPVSAWARAELAYRSNLAVQQASAAAPRPITPAPKSEQTAASWTKGSLVISDAGASPVKPTGEPADAAPSIRQATAAYRAATISPQRRDAAISSSQTGAIAPQGGWFAANMMHAIERYHHQKALAGETPRGDSGPVVN